MPENRKYYFGVPIAEFEDSAMVALQSHAASTADDNR